MLDSLIGGQLGTTAKFAIAFILVLGLIGITALIIRRFGAGGMPSSGGGRGRQPRLAVLDSAVVDAKRRLVLIRRDNSEHLLLIGGPSDVVVETNIVRSTGPMPQMQAQSERRPAREARGAPHPQEAEYESSIVPETSYEEPPAPMPAPRPQPAAYSPPPPLPPRAVAHPAPMPQQSSPLPPPAPTPQPQPPSSKSKLDPQYADMAQRLEAALRKPATAPAPKAPETRPMPQAAQPRPAPMPQTRPMPASPAPAVSQPALRPGPASAQSAPNPFDSLEAEMASLLEQDKKR